MLIYDLLPNLSHVRRKVLNKLKSWQRWFNVCSPFLSYVGAHANLLEAGSPRSTR